MHATIKSSSLKSAPIPIPTDGPDGKESDGSKILYRYLISGGFCNYPISRLVEQLTHWVDQGIPRVKIKTSRYPDQYPERLSSCSNEIGNHPVLMTDANGALTRKEALYWAKRFREEWSVAWMEEPVSTEDLHGLRLLLTISTFNYHHAIHKLIMNGTIIVKSTCAVKNMCESIIRKNKITSEFIVRMFGQSTNNRMSEFVFVDPNDASPCTYICRIRNKGGGIYRDDEFRSD